MPRLPRCRAAAVLLACVAMGAAADPLPPWLHTEVSAKAGFGTFAADFHSDLDEAASGVVASSASAVVSHVDGSGSSQAQAVAAFGVLGLYGLTQSFGAGGYGSVTAMASFRDAWTIGAPGLAGTAGTLFVTVTVEGTRVADWPDTSVTLQQGEACVAPIGSCRLDFSSGGGVQTFAAGVTFTFGDAFGYQLLLDGQTAADLYYRSGSIDYLHSARISALDVRDAQGQPVTAFTLTAASGHDYGLDPPPPVPEPSTWALWLAGCALLARSPGLRAHRRGVARGAPAG